MSWKGYIRATRPLNAIVAGIAVLLGYIIAAGTLAPCAFFLIPVVTFITAAGNVVNDYCDREIDRVNRPDRPIPSGDIVARSALIYSILLFAAGLCITILLGKPLLLVIAAFNSALLVLYAARLKGIALLGNATVAYLASSIFLFGGAALGIPGLLKALPLACIVFLAMLSRELLKDAEDVLGDEAGGARTVPMIIGVKNTARLGFLCAFAAVLMTYLPIFTWWGIYYILAISIANSAILVGAFRALKCELPECIGASQATSLIKSGMFIAVAVFIIGAVIA
jgi:geranylgeranylglycerol-phosphate geranylgeranyltransferase